MSYAAACPALLAVLGGVILVGTVLISRLRRREARHLRDLDTLLITLSRLPSLDPERAGDLVCALAADVAGARQAVLYQSRSGRFVVSGTHGRRSGEVPPVDGPIEAALTDALRDGLLQRHPLVVPILHGRRAVGAIVVEGCRRHLDMTALAVLSLIGRQLGPTLDEVQRTHSHLSGGIRPSQDAPALVADLAVGDALVLITPCWEAGTTAGDPRQDDALLGDLGRFLDDVVRRTDDIARIDHDKFLVILRSPQLPVEVIVGRLSSRWGRQPTLRAGCAVHLDGLSPLDTLVRARKALDTSRDTHGVLAVASNVI